MIITRPPMGWNTWNTFGADINENLIKETADYIASSGLKALGYEYVIIDDCWAEKKRDENGHLVPSREKFPHGMKALADYIHSKGLKFGMYSCCGTLTCAQYPGSYDHEFEDAKTFASWGVDYLKYDHCYKPEHAPSYLLYRKMGLALRESGRDILYATCSWGINETPDWVKSTGAHTWRSTGDIFDNWERVKIIYNANRELQCKNGYGHFNDMDMLIVGMHGKGHVGLGGCTFEEYKTHFSVWAMLSSPLIIGCDVRSMDDEAKQILMNNEVIAINQDCYNQPFEVRYHNEVWGTFWIKYLEDGDIAILALNMLEEEKSPYLPLSDIGIDGISGNKLHLKDLWSKEEFDAEEALVCKALPAHSCRLFRAKIIEP